MSIQTDLTRIKNAKAAIKAAIEGKGVTVPEATLLDGMAALIESIEAGGTNNIITGSFTLIEDLTPDNPVFIDIEFPFEEFPIAYGVFDASVDLSYNDITHQTIILNSLISIKRNEGFFIAIASYKKAGSPGLSTVGGITYYPSSNDYSDSGGIYSSMNVSLSKKQIKFTGSSSGWYIAGRPYFYFLIWG